MIESKIICDSLAPSGVRLTTFVLTYPRFIHSEFMTHRVFSRNASSSRAIPVKKSIQMVIDNPAIPLAFTKNKAGMQGGDALTGDQEAAAVKAWLDSRDAAVIQAKALSDLEVHKQYANRVLEPFSHITVVASATDLDNFFSLRCHEMAQPEIHALADKMYDDYSDTTPRELGIGEWHLPFITTDDVEEANAHHMGLIQLGHDSPGAGQLLVMKSVAKCARTSYLTHEGKITTLEEDLALYHRLVGSEPLHASPAEHQALAVSDPSYRSGNFRGWQQYRQGLVGQNVTEFQRK